MAQQDDDSVHSRRVGSNIEKAKGGDTVAAKALIREFCATVNQNRQRLPDESFKRTADGWKIPHSKPSGIHTQFDECLLDYFVECFERIGDVIGEGEKKKITTSDVALNIAAFGKRGPKAKAITREEILRRGMAVWLKRNEQKASVEKACAAIAEEEKMPVETIWRDYKEFRKLLAHFR